MTIRGDSVLRIVVVTLPALLLLILFSQSHSLFTYLAGLGTATCVSIWLTNIYIVTRLTDIQILMEAK